MADKIIIRRGLRVNLPTLSEGELGFCTDTKEYFIGSNIGNILLSKSGVIESLTTALEDIELLELEVADKADAVHNHSLETLDDVNATSKTDGYVLTYDMASNKFVLKAPTGGGSGTVEGPLHVTLDGMSIYLPTDIRGVEKRDLYTYESASVAANTVLTSNVFDLVNTKLFTGTIASSHSATAYIQQSSDQNSWFTTNEITVGASPLQTIGGNPYYSPTKISVQVSLRYVRVLFVVGGTALTKLSIRFYGSSL